MYVKFNPMPDTYLVIAIIYDGVRWGGGGDIRRMISKGELFKTY